MNFSILCCFDFEKQKYEDIGNYDGVSNVYTLFRNPFFFQTRGGGFDPMYLHAYYIQVIYCLTKN